MDVDEYNKFADGLNSYQASQTENALKIRLETEDTLEVIEMYLSGEAFAEEINPDGSRYAIKIKPVGVKPKANPEGVREIMRAIKSYINKSTVQGNLTSDEINNIVMPDFHKAMANLLAFHCDEWEIGRNERKSIVNFIEPHVYLFISRTKDNKERESYNMAIREVGRQIYENPKRNFSLFGKREV